MIAKEELRIGNHVKFPYQKDNEYLVIEGIKDDYIYYSARSVSNMNAPLDAIEPIPITEDLLLRLGFEKDGESYNSPSDEFDIILHQNEGMWTASNVFINSIQGISSGENFVCMGDCFKYIHQLQNLYFALTGQELTLTNNNELT